MDFSQFFEILEGVLLSIGAGIAGLYTMSKKFRIWINNKLKDTDSIKDLNKKQTELEKKETALENSCALRSEKIDELYNDIKKTINKIDAKLEKDKESTILTLKCQILDICSRASRYGGITKPDKELLCDLYHQYVDVWKENHYVKSEADKVIKTAKIINEYKEQMIEIVKGQA